jgi:hypothetical protein
MWWSRASDLAPQACLLDSGATAIRLGAHVAELCGVELRGAPRPGFGLLGLTGFFDQFDVTIAAYEERIALTPISL